MTTEHHAVENAVGRPGLDVLHSQKVRLGEVRLSAEAGIARDLALSVMVPLRYVKTSIRYIDVETGQDVELEVPDIHHRTERLFEMADAWLLAHAAHATQSWAFDARVGVSLPTGHTSENPFALGDRGMAHQHLQFGTGTVNPILGAEVRRVWPQLSLSANALTQQAFYENGKGYHAGDRYAGGLAAESPLGTSTFSFRAGPEIQMETAERWDGVVPTDDGNRGRWDLLVGLGAARRFPGGFFVSLGAHVRLYTEVVGGQLEYPAVFELGVGWARPGRPVTATTPATH